MKLLVSLLASAAVAALVFFSPGTARAGCLGAPDGKCDPGMEDCACADCLAACSGECTPSNPACTFEDACTCKECWADPSCTNPKKTNCTNDGTCDFFTEGCCCDDCAMLANCTGFDGDCGQGTGGTGGTGGTTGGSGGAVGGSGGSGGATGGSGGDAGGGLGGLAAPKSGCGCSVPGGVGDGGLAFCVAAVGAGLLARKRRARAALAHRA